MTDPRDPVRLTDDPATSEELRDVIGTLRAGGRDPRSRAEVAAGLGSLLEDPSAPPGEGPPGGSSGSGGAGVSGATRALLIGSATGALVLLALVFSATREPEPITAPLPAAHSTAPVPEPASAPVEAPEEVPATLEPVEPAPAPARPARRASADTTEDSEPQLPTEIGLLREARAAVATRPARALELCARHRRHYPNGVLAEEREVIAVKALIALGSRDEARRRAEAFLRVHASSAHRAQVEALLEQANSENGSAAR